MSSITSRRSGEFYLSITFGVLFCFVMALRVGGLVTQAKSTVGEIMDPSENLGGGENRIIFRGE